MALLTVFGFNTGASIVLQYFIFGNPSAWATSGLAAKFSLIILAVGFVGIVASFFGRQPSESYVIIPLMAILISFIADFVSILNMANDTGMSWIYYVVLLVIFPLVVGYSVALVQWWRGNDI